MAASGPLVPSYPQSFPQIVWMVDNRRFDPPAVASEAGRPRSGAHVVLQRTSPLRQRWAEWRPGFSSHNPRVRRRALSHVEGVELLKIVQEAGWPIWPLILCSIAAVALIVERFMALRTARVGGQQLQAGGEDASQQRVLAQLGDDVRRPVVGRPRSCNMT